MSMKDLSGYGPDRHVTGFTLKWVFWGIGILVLLSIVLIPVGLALGWGRAAANVVSPDNVKKQWAFAYQYDEDLQATARNVCIAEKAVADAPDANAQNQRQSQLIAQQSNYNRIEADYNAKLRNAFEAKLVKPSDVPDKAPSLPEMKKRVGCSP